MDVGALVKEQYQVIEHIGRGGMADVWSARDTRLQRLVAIKTIAHGLSAEMDPVALFEREARTIASMEHPHILPIYDFGEYEANLYIVMRLITGGSLEDSLHNGPLPPEKVLAMGQNIAQALDYAHENNVIHLDLKPPNILLDSSQAPYLADFGLATVLDPEGRARNPGSGTLLYMAPEQLVAETIDHRADIYSFCIMLFHMFTGQLPFDGAQPLAIRQLQANQRIPEVEEFVPELSYQVTDILRLGTAQEANQRPPTHMEIIEQLKEAIQPSSYTVSDGSYDPFDDPFADPFNDPMAGQMMDSMDADLLEAVDIYSRARHTWSAGQGRFLLGVTHFMLMADYYSRAQELMLDLDENGYQMILRGALEYDYQLEYWWSQVDDDARRWVSLHALRSGTTPSRKRALQYLETLPDDESNPVIIKLVAQALEVENDPDARIAALRVLSVRSKLVKPNQPYQVKTEFAGRLLTSMTRLGIELAPQSEWNEAIYSPEIDLLIADNAFHANAEVAEYAARTVGRIRSLTGVRYISTEQRDGRNGALRALAFVRDESPSLPDEVTPQGRFYAWLTNTIRRLTDQPIDGILRFLFALLGGAVGMGQVVYITFRSQSLFTAQRWGNTLAIGLVFGVFVGTLVLMSDEFSKRLHGFWSWWLRLALFGILGFLMGMITWSGFTWFYLQYIPLWDVMRFAGFTLAFGLVMSALLNLYGWRSILLVTVMGFLPLWALHNNFYDGANFSLHYLAPFGLFVGGILGLMATRDRLGNTKTKETPRPAWQLSPLTPFAMAGIGFAWAFIIWQTFNNMHTLIGEGIPPTWDTMLGLLLASLMVGIGVGFIFNKPRRNALAFFAVAFGAYALFEITGAWQFSDQILTLPSFNDIPLSIIYADGLPLAPVPEVPIIYFDDKMLGNWWTITLPVMFTIAIGANAQSLTKMWNRRIGEPYDYHERHAWFTGGISYVLVMSVVVSILAIFSAHVDIAWALVWSFGGFVTFVFALGAWRWAKWGAEGLALMSLFVILGGFLYDFRDILMSLEAGDFPILFMPIEELANQSSVAIWAVYSIWLGAFAWGILRKKLWAGIGALLFIPLWLFLSLFTPVSPSITTLIMANVAMLMYALKSQWQELEVNRIPIDEAVEIPISQPASNQFETVAKPLNDEAESVSFDEVEEDVLQDTELAPHPVPVSDIATELDPASAIENEADAIETELDPASALDEKPKITLDTSTLKSDTDKPKITFDKGTAKSLNTNVIPDSNKPKITLDTGALKSKSNKPKITLDTSTLKSDTDKPKITFDKGTLKPQNNLNTNVISEDDKSKITLDTDTLKSKSNKPKITLDTDTLKTKTDKPKITLNTDTLKSKNDKLKITLDSDALRTEKRKPRIQLDTGQLRSKPASKPPTNQNDESGNDGSENKED